MCAIWVFGSFPFTPVSFENVRRATTGKLPPGGIWGSATNMTSHAVTLRVYDLSRGLAKQLSPALLGKQIDGIWHTGVLVFGNEYFFGGGIQVMAPEFVVARYGMQPVDQVHLGETTVPKEQFETYLRSINHRFTAETYDLLRHNCNNFSNELAQYLLGKTIPQHILDLPNEALSTPLGAMLRPVLENMQREMNATGTQPFAIPFNDPSLATATVSAASSVNVASSGSPVTLSRKFTISTEPTLHFDRIIRRIKQLNSQEKALLSEDEIEALESLAKDLVHHKIDLTDSVNHSDDAHVKKTMQLWEMLLKLQDEGSSSSFFFPSLGLFRVLLLLPAKSDGIVALKNLAFDHLLQATESEDITLSPAQTTVLLSVLVNAFANPVSSDLVQARAVQFLPFVFRCITDSNVKNDDIRVLSAKLISNCCLALRMEEEMVITTIICGCAEVLDRLARENQSSPTQHVQHTLEGVVGGIGLLLQNFQAARSLSVELGLAEVLHRLHSAPSLRPIQPLLSQVVSLI